VGKKRAEEILTACPDFVDCILSEDNARIEFARCACNIHSATAARWVEKAIEHIEDLRLSRELVTLRLFELECIEKSSQG
jgi:hypothetical protein